MTNLVILIEFIRISQHSRPPTIKVVDHLRRDTWTIPANLRRQATDWLEIMAIFSDITVLDVHMTTTTTTTIKPLSHLTNRTELN